MNARKSTLMTFLIFAAFQAGLWIGTCFLSQWQWVLPPHGLYSN